MGDIARATKSTCTGKDQSIILAIGKEVVVVRPSTSFLLVGNTHCSIKTYSSLHVSSISQVGLLSAFWNSQNIQNVRANFLGHPLLVLSSPPLHVWWDWLRYPYGNNMG
jgi:hypothetical protein